MDIGLSSLEVNTCVYRTTSTLLCYALRLFFSCGLAASPMLAVAAAAATRVKGYFRRTVAHIVLSFSLSLRRLLPAGTPCFALRFRVFRVDTCVLPSSGFITAASRGCFAPLFITDCHSLPLPHPLHSSYCCLLLLLLLMLLLILLCATFYLPVILALLPLFVFR